MALCEALKNFWVQTTATCARLGHKRSPKFLILKFWVKLEYARPLCRAGLPVNLVLQDRVLHQKHPKKSWRHPKIRKIFYFPKNFPPLRKFLKFFQTFAAAPRDFAHPPGPGRAGSGRSWVVQRAWAYGLLANLPPTFGPLTPLTTQASPLPTGP